MKKLFSTYIDKLFFKKWTIGLGRGSIENMIREKKFDAEIQWIDLETNKRFIADPFFLPERDGLKLLLEDFSSNDHYGKISIVELDEKLKIKESTILLDTTTHLSYPFIFKENERIFVFPESGDQNKLACYEYYPGKKSLTFLKNILELPLFDVSVVKHANKYWLFGIFCNEDGSNYELNIYVSDSLLGNYVPHQRNPVKQGLNGTRPAGDFIFVDGEIYRPAQNCQNEYGESITIFKITTLSEQVYAEIPYMNIDSNSLNMNNKRISKIHTINSRNGYVVVDGMIHVFAPWLQLKNSVKFRLQNRKNKYCRYPIESLCNKKP
jgi:hypothetical protein